MKIGFSLAGLSILGAQALKLNPEQLKDDAQAINLGPEQATMMRRDIPEFWIEKLEWAQTETE